MKVGFIFPGQGSQAAGMGRDFIDNRALAKTIIEEASESIKINMREILEDSEQINQTKFTQSSILLISYIAAMLFKEKMDIKPVFGLGHSLGEITANVIANSISFSAAMTLVYKRGELMQKACEEKNAGMAAVIGLDDNVVEEFCGNNADIWCANYNTDGQIIVAGTKEVLTKAQDEMKNLGAKRFLILPISIASHCPILSSITDEFHAILQDSLNTRFDFEIISNATTKAYNTKEQALELLTMQLIKPVYYKQSISAHQDKVDCFVEFGHGGILKGLNKRLSNKPTHCISDTKSLQVTLDELAQ